ncbi:MAG: beta-propeller fold lactonase family protein, partial [Acidobacteriota bacterium]
MTAIAAVAASCLLTLSGCAGGDADGDATAGDGAQKRTPKTYSIESFLDTTVFAGASFSPDNRHILVSSDASGVFNAYAVPVAGGDPVALTDSTDQSIFAVGYFPEDERFLYLSDQGGNELNHLYVRELDGTVKDLTPGENLRASFYGWADDGASFFVGTTERDPRFVDVYEVDEKGMVGERVAGLAEGRRNAHCVRPSPDNRFVYIPYVKETSAILQYRFDAETGALSPLSPKNANPPEGTGPRHLAYHPTLPIVYFSNEQHLGV